MRVPGALHMSNETHAGCTAAEHNRRARPQSTAAEQGGGAKEAAHTHTHKHTHTPGGVLDRLQPYLRLQVTDLGIISDNEAGLERALQKAVDGETDILMTSGWCWLQDRACTQPLTGAQPLTADHSRCGSRLCAPHLAETCKHVKAGSMPAVLTYHADSPQECMRLTLLQLCCNNALDSTGLPTVGLFTGLHAGGLQAGCLSVSYKQQLLSRLPLNLHSLHCGARSKGSR